MINGAVSVLRFLFDVTLDQADVSRQLVLAHRPRKLPDVLSVEEVAKLLEAAPGIKYRAALRSVRRWPACIGGRAPKSRRYRQQADADPHRGRQGAQGPQRHAVAATASVDRRAKRALTHFWCSEAV
jgi:hypothetical protein